MVAFLYIVWFSYLVKRMVSSPTSNFQALTALAHVITYLIATLFTIAIGFIFGFGLSVCPYFLSIVLVNPHLWHSVALRKIVR